MKEILAITISPIGGEREKETLAVLQRNAKRITEVVKKFEDVITALLSERDIKKAQRLSKEVSELETKADAGRRKFASGLSQGAFLPAFRGDLARLAERVDAVADVAEGVARAFLLREKLLSALLKAERRQAKAKDLRTGLVKMAKLATQTAEALEASIRALVTNIDVALAKAKEVERLEHESDMVEQALLADVYEYEKLLDPVSVLMLNELIRGVGDISDRAEDAVDVLEILSYMFKA